MVNLDALLVRLLVALMGVVIALLIYIYRIQMNRLSVMESKWHNFGRSVFMLIAKLHPDKAPAIVAAFADSHKANAGNGHAKEFDSLM